MVVSGVFQATEQNLIERSRQPLPLPLSFTLSISLTLSLIVIITIVNNFISTKPNTIINDIKLYFTQAMFLSGGLLFYTGPPSG